MFSKPDFLVIGPHCWGRAKTPRAAFRLAKANCPHTAKDLAKVKGPAFTLYALADDTDRVRIDDSGAFSWDGPTRPKVVALLAGSATDKAVPETIHPDVLMQIGCIGS